LARETTRRKDDHGVPSRQDGGEAHIELATRSGFPNVALLHSPRTRRIWLQSYLDDLLTQDAEDAENSPTKRRDSGRLKAYFEAYVLNSAGVPEHNDL